MIAALEKYGFAALYVNRKGYEDRGIKLIEELRAADRSRVIESPNHDLVAILLTPSQNPVLPEPPPQFTSGWYGEEGDGKGQTWHNSSGNAELLLHNSSPAPRKVLLEFELASPSPRIVEIWARGQLLYRSPALNSNRIAHSLVFELPPGATTLSFKTEPPVTFPGNPDTRLLSFVLYNWRTTNADQ
jgi:phosphoglycerol transferase